MTFLFGDFAFDKPKQELRRGEKPVHLTPKAMRLLELLLERRGRLVSRAEIFDHLWPDVVVSEAALKNLISTLRCALDDHSREGRFIRNVHDRGYLFQVEAIEVEPRTGPVLAHLQWEDRSIPLCEGIHIVGRQADCTVVLHDLSVSRQHARIGISSRGITVEDLGSRNGTFIDDERAVGVVPVTRSKICFGAIVTYLSLVDDECATLEWP
jgi:DNA-binding winged helix-turn-helix (wHTH) protein